MRTGADYGLSMEVSSAAVRANELPTRTLIAHMERDLGGLGDKLIAVWGLAFKPKTDDVREAPGIKMIAELVARGARVRTTDPQARETARESMTLLGLMGSRRDLGQRVRDLPRRGRAALGHGVERV